MINCLFIRLTVQDLQSSQIMKKAIFHDVDIQVCVIYADNREFKLIKVFQN